MCGIAGIVTTAWPGDAAGRLAAATDCLAHRGPDGRGFLLWPPAGGALRAKPEAAALRRAEGGGPTVALAHRRLAIIDLSPAAGQPMVSADGRLAVVLNGEIYNYRELRADLERGGRRFRTASDTEVLLEGYAAWGTGVLARLVGMFAFALLDTERRHVLLARDPFGIKPLYLARAAEAIAFASEVGALLRLDAAPPAIHPQAAAHFLWLREDDAGDRTMFAGIERVAPGCALEIPLDDPGRPAVLEHWRPGTAAPRSDLTFAQATEACREQFLESVRLHLVSDVPIGFALSGGQDSSAIVTAARRVLGPGASLQAFVYVPDQAELSEERFAALAADAAGADLHRVRIRAEEVAAEWDDLAWHQGEPIHGPIIYAQRRVFQRAAEAGVKVLLEGQGGDELLGGYDRYVVARAASLLRRGRLGAARALLAPLGGRPSRALLRAAGLAWRPVHGALAAGRRARSRRRRPDLAGLSAAWLERHGVRPVREAHRPSIDATPLHAALIESVHGIKLQALLRFGDRNAMTASQENRVPFLTPRLADFVLSLPEEYLVSADGTRKAVLRAAMRGIVPDPILARTDKIGFATPVVDWLIALTPWVERRLGRLAELPLVDTAAVRAQWQTVRATRNLTGALQIWRWLSLEAWVTRYGVKMEA